MEGALYHSPRGDNMFQTCWLQANKKAAFISVLKVGLPPPEELWRARGEASLADFLGYANHLKTEAYSCCCKSNKQYCFLMPVCARSDAPPTTSSSGPGSRTDCQSSWQPLRVSDTPRLTSDKASTDVATLPFSSQIRTTQGGWATNSLRVSVHGHLRQYCHADGRQHGEELMP